MGENNAKSPGMAAIMAPPLQTKVRKSPILLLSESDNISQWS